MKATEFCYWLQGMFELAEPKSLDGYQVETIKKHLDMVFLHEIDKSYPEKEQTQLNEIHNTPVMRC